MHYTEPTVGKSKSLSKYFNMINKIDSYCMLTITVPGNFTETLMISAWKKKTH